MVYIAYLNDPFIDPLLYLNEYYGITQDPETKDFIIIMKYYKSDLRSYITKDFYNIEWNKKLKILLYIAKGLNYIHSQNIIHRDLHSGNILYENENDVIISDLGISKSAMESTCDEKCYGIISYMAPEILQKKEYTISSDIYSYGMIMYEFIMGKIPFRDQKHDIYLKIKICDGFRPSITTNAPGGYIKLMQECWNSDPNKRPKAADIVKRLSDILRNELNDPTEITPSSSLDTLQVLKSFETSASYSGN